MKSSLRSIGILAVLLVAVPFVLAFGPQQGKKGETSNRPTTARIEYRPTLLVQLRVADLERSVHFYRDLLDMKVVHRNDALKWVKVSHGIDGVTIGLGQAEDVGGSGTLSINLGVRDIDAARRLLEQRGVKFEKPTITIPGVVKLADLRDPDGNKIRLAESLTSDAREK